MRANRRLSGHAAGNAGRRVGIGETRREFGEFQAAWLVRQAQSDSKHRLRGECFREQVSVLTIDTLGLAC